MQQKQSPVEGPGSELGYSPDCIKKQEGEQTQYGALPEEWGCLVKQNITGDLLPVVSDPRCKISPSSTIKYLGKTPSRFNAEGDVIGIKHWTKYTATDADIKAWIADPRLGICVQTRRVRAFDIDVEDREVSSLISDVIQKITGPLPMRTRPNSGKCLLVFKCPGNLTKQVINFEGGIVEFLGNGQQFIAVGTHPSGVKYEWPNGLPESIPEINYEMVKEVLEIVFMLCGTSKSPSSSPSSSDRGEVLLKSWQNDPVSQALHDRGLVLSIRATGEHVLNCPWSNEHTDQDPGTSTMFFPPHTGGFKGGGFRCFHAHCSDRTIKDLKRFLDLTPTTETVFDDLDIDEELCEPKSSKPLTDAGNAELFAEMHARNFHYIPAWGCWIYWNGRYWQKAETGEAFRAIKEVTRQREKEALGETDENIRAHKLKFAAKCQSKTSIEAVEKLARYEPGISIVPAILDSYTMLLNCQNGTIDLQTGLLRPHNRDDMLTKCLTISYDPNAKAQKWLDFITWAMSGDIEMVKYIQKIFGYCLTGATTEQVFMYFYGTGDNGKSVVLEVLVALLSVYAKRLSSESFMVQNTGNAIPNDIAALQGCRLVIANEVKEGRRLDESKIKELTGGDTITARYLHKEWFEYRPQFKIILVGNHKPTITGTDEGIWRRVRQILFKQKIEADRKDRLLLQKLLTQLPGILAWAVEGCLLWQKEGLGMPQPVADAVAEYRRDSDIIGDFLEQKVEPVENDGTYAHELYEKYAAWAKANGFHAVTSKMLTRKLHERGFQSRKTNGRLLMIGIKLRDEWGTAVESAKWVQDLCRKGGMADPVPLTS
ncbi:MAG: bifunctional DNA primase/polymerase [Magnetococcales bacterium]|nr:bifunctional DNA primase/polymerase [Magnetococcales bacterium]